jgi:hypothetical protein
MERESVPETLIEKQPKARPRRPKRVWARLLARFIRIITRRPTRVIAITVLVAVVAAFLVNALVLQAGRHPAPLFARWLPGGRDAVLPPERPSAAIPLPPTDPITSLLATGESKDVLFTQRALNRLGYGPLKADGLAGVGTRQAIEKFQRDRKLPVTGEISRKLIGDLATASGLAPD